MFLKLLFNGFDFKLRSIFFFFIDIKNRSVRSWSRGWNERSYEKELGLRDGGGVGIRLEVILILFFRMLGVLVFFNFV